MFNKQLLAIIILGLIGLGLFVGLYSIAFPQAALKIEISHQEAQNNALNYLKKLGFSVDEYKKSTVFELRENEQVFLQRSLGIAKFNESIVKNPDLTPWRFATRFFKPLQKEEFTVYTSGAGKIIAFGHLIDDSKEGGKLTKDESLNIIKRFSEANLNINLSDYEEKEYKDQKQENRIDHFFSFELKNSQIGWSKDPGASKGGRRITFNVRGDKVESYNQFVFVPEDFQRKQDETNASGLLYVAIAAMLNLALIIGAIVILFKRYKSSDLRSKFFVWLAAIMASLTLIAMLSSFEQQYFYYPTSEPWINFIVIYGISALIAAIFTAVMILAVSLPAESLTREIFPASNNLMVSTHKEIWQSSIKGFSFGFFFLGYIALFYYIGLKYFSIWSPITPETADYMASPLPFFIPIVISLGAAISEEFTFRYFGISFLKKYLKYTWIALLIPAIIWAFLHSTYPVYPMHIRGIELTIGGLIFGYIFLRHGIVTAIIAHYVVDAVLFSIPLILSQNYYFKASGIAAILFALIIPIAYSLFIKLKKRDGGNTSLETPPQKL